MNSKIIDILIKTNNFEEEINVCNRIGEFLRKEEVVYDGSVISAYDLNKILKEKMDYLKDLSDPSNYKINEEEFLEMLKSVHWVNYWFNREKYKTEKIEKFNIYLDSVQYGFFSYGRDFKQSFIKYLIFISTNKSNELSFAIYKSFDEFEKDKIYREILGIDDGTFKYRIEKIYDYHHDENIASYIDNFVESNREILEELFLTIQDIYSGIEPKLPWYDTNFSYTTKYDDWKIIIYFDLKRKSSGYKLTCLDDGLSADDYQTLEHDEILKRISINIEDLNPFYKNEIDRYYNSINKIDYKVYRREK